MITNAFTLSALGFLIATSLLYGRDLENRVLLKYWVIFIFGVVIIKVPLDSPFIAGIFGMVVAFMLLVKAKFPGDQY